MMPSRIKNIWSFFKNRKCARKMFIVFVSLGDLNKTSNRAVTHTSFNKPKFCTKPSELI